MEVKRCGYKATGWLVFAELDNVCQMGSITPWGEQSDTGALPYQTFRMELSIPQGILRLHFMMIKTRLRKPKSPMDAAQRNWHNASPQYMDIAVFHPIEKGRHIIPADVYGAPLLRLVREAALIQPHVWAAAHQLRKEDLIRYYAHPTQTAETLQPVLGQIPQTLDSSSAMQLLRACLGTIQRILEHIAQAIPATWQEERVRAMVRYMRGHSGAEKQRRIASCKRP